MFMNTKTYDSQFIKGLNQLNLPKNLVDLIISGNSQNHPNVVGENGVRWALGNLSHQDVDSILKKLVLTEIVGQGESVENIYEFALIIYSKDSSQCRNIKKLIEVIYQDLNAIEKYIFGNLQGFFHGLYLNNKKELENCYSREMKKNAIDETEVLDFLNQKSNQISFFLKEKYGRCLKVIKKTSDFDFKVKEMFI